MKSNLLPAKAIWLQRLVKVAALCLLAIQPARADLRLNSLEQTIIYPKSELTKSGFIICENTGSVPIKIKEVRASCDSCTEVLADGDLIPAGRSLRINWVHTRERKNADRKTVTIYLETDEPNASRHMVLLNFVYQ